MMRKLIRYAIIAILACAGWACGSDSEDGGKLELKSDRSQIVADGVETVSFTVTEDGVDVTAEAKIYQGTSAIAGHTFATTEVGKYRFTASYNGVLSNDVTVESVTPASYRKKALVTIWSSTNCVHCPKMARQLKNVWMTERPGQVVPLYFHTRLMVDDDDPFIVKDSDGLPLFAGQMASWFNCIGGLPKACVDADYTIDYLSGSSRLDIALNRQTQTGIAISSVINGQKLEVTVRTKGDADYANPAGLAVWLLENGRNEPQLDGDANGENQFVEYEYIHNYIVRAALCDDYTGILIPEAYRKAGQEYEYKYTYTIPADFVKENLQVVAYVYENVATTVSSSGHLVLNAQMAQAGSDSGYDYVNTTEK